MSDRRPDTEGRTTGEPSSSSRSHTSPQRTVIAGTGGEARRSDNMPQSVEGLWIKALPAAGEPAFPLAHDYFEIVYAPMIGPTAVLLARAMMRHLEAANGPTIVSPVELALEVGIRASSADPLGKKSHLVRTIDRLAHDRIVSRLGDRVLGVRLAVPPLSERALEKLPALALEAHRGFVAYWFVAQDPDDLVPKFGVDDAE